MKSLTTKEVNKLSRLLDNRQRQWKRRIDMGEAQEYICLAVEDFRAVQRAVRRLEIILAREEM